MRIYYVEEVPGHEGVFMPTRAEAMLHANEVANATKQPVTVRQIDTVRITPAMLCNVLGGWGGYSAREKVLCTVRPVK